MSHRVYEELTAEQKKVAPKNAFYYRPSNGLYYTKQGFPIIPPANDGTHKDSVDVSDYTDQRREA